MMTYVKSFQFVLEPCCLLECGAEERCLSDPDRIYSCDLLLLTSAVSYTAETADTWRMSAFTQLLHEGPSLWSLMAFSGLV